MATKEVTISNIKFNLSTEPLVNDPEVYPDYPSVPVNQILQITFTIPLLQLVYTSQYTSIKTNLVILPRPN